jgi:asparagine synthase (glutamine-hydrolysing)
VVDTSCAALLLLAQAVHGQGFKVALTGEGSDEWLCGYPWYKTHRLLSWLDVIPGLRLSHAVRRAYLKWAGAPAEAWPVARQAHQLLGGHNPWMDLYGLITMGKWGLFSRGLLDQFRSQSFYHDLGIPEQLKRWHPLNRGVWLAGRTHLAGLLLAAKGDRVAMHSSVETRYPFLDEEVFAFLAKVPPKYKLHGLRDKFLLRHLAQRWLPKEVAWRRKAMFRAPFDSFHADHLPPFVDQLLSEESLRKTGYFDPAAVAGWRQRFRSLPAWLPQRMGIEMGLAGVVATQLWHHTFLDGSLADLPSAERGARNAERSENADSEPSRSALPVPR